MSSIARQVHVRSLGLAAMAKICGERWQLAGGPVLGEGGQGAVMRVNAVPPVRSAPTAPNALHQGWRREMSLTLQLDRYLSVRRNLGYDLRTSERILHRFTRFADREGIAYIDTALFLRWHATLQTSCAQTRAARLSVIRLFAQWLSGFDAAHEVPPRGLLPSSVHRSRPHIYSDDEIRMIITAAKALPSIYGLRGLTFSTLFGLIAVTGLRIGEALALDRNDLDTAHGVLRVRQGKLGKERLLPLDPSIVTCLIDYLAERDRLIGHLTELLFVNDRAARLTDCTARYMTGVALLNR